MALLYLEQLLRGVFVIAVPPTMGVGKFEEYHHTSIVWFYLLVTHFFAFVLHQTQIIDDDNIQH